MWEPEFHPNLNSDYDLVFHPDTVEKKEWPAEGRTINLIWQPAKLCEGQPTLVSDWPMSVWALTLAQDNQLLTRCSHSQLYLAYSLFVKKLLIPEVCMCCMYTYVCAKPYYRTWTYQPEKMSHTSLCVRVIHFILPAGCDEINQVQVSLFDLCPLRERGAAVRGQQPQLWHVDTLGWVMLNINHPTPQWWWHATVELPDKTLHLWASLECNTLTPAMSPHTLLQPLFSQISQYTLDSDHSL